MLSLETFPSPETAAFQPTGVSAKCKVNVIFVPQTESTNKPFTFLQAEARTILALAAESGCQIPLPSDVVVGKSFSDCCPAYNKSLNHIADDDMIMDIGPETVARYLDILDHAKTIIWNGPVGVFEFPQFSYGTRALAIAIANSDAFSIAGGGDTLAAIDQYDLTDQISYISTGGGAFLEYLEGRTLPAVAVLEARAGGYEQ